MQRKNNIHGIMMRPCSLTEEDNEQIMQSTQYSVKENFLTVYQNHMVAMEIVSECAKIYITKNWEKITDWTNLNVIIEDNTSTSTEYYNYVKETRRRRPKTKVKQHSSSTIDELFSRMDEEDKKRHNPIKTITDVVLDTTDGDFSLTINDKQHLWISDDSVIIIANFIEKTLNKK